jgi:hypothetical protein
MRVNGQLLLVRGARCTARPKGFCVNRAESDLMETANKAIFDGGGAFMQRVGVRRAGESVLTFDETVEFM